MLHFLDDRDTPRSQIRPTGGPKGAVPNTTVLTPLWIEMIISSSFGLIFPFNSMPLFQPYLNIKPYRWGSCKKMECPWSNDVARGWILCDMQQLTVDPLEHWPVLGFMLNFKGLVIKNFERHGFLFLNNYPFNKPCFLFESFISGRLPGWSIDMGAKTILIVSHKICCPCFHGDNKKWKPTAHVHTVDMYTKNHSCLYPLSFSDTSLEAYLCYGTSWY